MVEDGLWAGCAMGEWGKGQWQNIINSQNF